MVSTTKQSRGPISDGRPQRQWDYPFGWPPHQMLAWQGLIDYGYEVLAQRLEARMQLGAHRAGRGTCFGGLWPAAPFAKLLGQVLADSQRVPHRVLAVLEHRHFPRRRVRADLPLPRVGIERNSNLAERDVELLQGQPGPQRP